MLNFLLPIIRAAIQISDLTLKCYSEVDRTQQRYSRPTMQRVKCQNQQRKAILKLHEGLQSLHIMLTIGSFIFFLLNILYKLQFVNLLLVYYRTISASPPWQWTTRIARKIHVYEHEREVARAIDPPRNLYNPPTPTAAGVQTARLSALCWRCTKTHRSR